MKCFAVNYFYNCNCFEISFFSYIVDFTALLYCVKFKLLVCWKSFEILFIPFQSKAAVKSNKDYEKEKKAEKEDFEKKIGLLTYLGQSVAKEKGI